MKRDELNRKVNEELKHIPRGSFDQNMLRAFYNSMRRHDLGHNQAFPAKNTLLRSIEMLKRNKPNFSPMYDRDFFQT